MATISSTTKTYGAMPFSYCALRELADIKTHESLRRITVVVMTSSNEERDVIKTYDLHANSYIVKPIDLTQFADVVSSIENFWFNVVVT